MQHAWSLLFWVVIAYSKGGTVTMHCTGRIGITMQRLSTVHNLVLNRYAPLAAVSGRALCLASPDLFYHSRVHWTAFSGVIPAVAK